MTGRYVTQKVSNFWKLMLSHNSFFYRKQSLLPPCYALSNVKYFDAFSIRSRRTKRSLQQQYVVWGCTHLWELLTQRKLRTVSHHHIIENISHKNETLKWDFSSYAHKLTTIVKVTFLGFYTMVLGNYFPFITFQTLSETISRNKNQFLLLSFLWAVWFGASVKKVLAKCPQKISRPESEAEG